MKTKLRTSVRSLIEYSLRSGDLELVFFGTSRPVEAIRAHQRLQKSRPENFTGEVSVSHMVETETIILEINGRIDGVWIYPDRTVIEEIKTTTGDPDTVSAHENPLHWGQAKCYAYIYGIENGLDNIDVRLTYCQMDTGVVRDVVRTFPVSELEEFFNDIVARYIVWAERLASWIVIRDESIRNVPFPFGDYRPGQRRMAEEVYRTVRDEGRLIVQAPTGIGKTAAALFPAVKAIPGGLISKIFYLTARTTGKFVAEKALDDMRGHGLRLKSLTLTAKERICFRPESSCTPEECEYAKGHFDRVNDALRDAFERDDLTREAVEDIARRHRVCPFEFSLELALYADCIICDYNYAFDPRVYLRRFFEEEKNEYVFLVDESHNLVARARDMFSASIEKNTFLALRRSVKGKQDSVYKALGAVNRVMLEYRKRCEKNGGSIIGKEELSELLPKLRRFIHGAERWLSRNLKAPFTDELLDVYFTVNGFLKVAERYDERYVTIYETREGNLSVRLFCIDPSARMSEALGRCRSAVFFSATMVPTDYFRDVLGIGTDTNSLLLPSPFPRENLFIAVADRISTLYRNREKTKEDVAGAIAALAGSRRGNYLVFFPSYEYMTAVYEVFSSRFTDTDIMLQTQGMSEPDREAFLDRFSHDNTETLIGFAVMGGVFGEGIDLIGDRLTGAVIVGVGLPGLSNEREIIRKYFNEHGGKGFEFAYMYPGINKVLQAAGRVIRSEHDRGIVLLIDERFGTWRYSSLFPPEWRPVTVTDENTLREKLLSFPTERDPTAESITDEKNNQNSIEVK